MAMNRRTILLMSATGLAVATGLSRAGFFNTSKVTAAAEPNNRSKAMKKELQLDPHPEKIEPFVLDDHEWKMRLSKEAYYVLRNEGTERPFTSELNDEKRTGEFACAGCGLVLFTTEQKFDSGTGWPSFWDAINGRVETKTDYKLILPRTEYHCARCGGHQGHVFEDGPQPTGLRYCNNGVALKFTPS